MKKLFLKIASALHKVFPKKRLPLMDALFRCRMAQALAGRGARILFLGDSRLHEAEAAFNARPGWLNLAVAGSTANPDGLKWGAPLAAAVNPLAVATDWDGNDFLQGAEVKDVLNAHLQVRERIKIAVPNVAVLSYELCPLGLPANDPVNVKIAKFNAALKLAVGQDFVPLNDILAPGGTMLEKYDSGDRIHWTPAAFEDAVFPRTTEALKARGLV